LTVLVTPTFTMNPSLLSLGLWTDKLGVTHRPLSALKGGVVQKQGCLILGLGLNPASIANAGQQANCIDGTQAHREPTSY